MHRAGIAVAVGALAAGMAATAQAQIQGMPLFTNPRYATGVRVHADLGLPTDKNAGLGDYSVLQGGVTFALWRLGIGANIGATREDFSAIQKPGGGNVGTQSKITASALAQLRVLGGGRSLWSFSLFGGASMDVKAYDFAGLPDSIKNQLGGTSKVVTIPVGVALGIKLPLVIINPNLWVAPRMNLTKIVNCPSGTTCPNTDSQFRWAVGLDVPLMRIISVRAAYDSGKLYGHTVDSFGVGASIGIGGMR
jgi:hypothetical protein